MSIIPTQLATTNNTTVKTALQTESVISKTPLGSTPSSISTITTAEYSTGKDVVTVLTLNALAGAAASLGIGNIVYTFPAGQHLELVYGFSNLSLTAAGTAVNADVGLGSVVASGAVSVLSGTATFENRLTGQTIATDPAGGAAASALLGATGTGISLNVAGSVKNVFLNAAGGWNANNVGSLTASGVITLKWTIMNA